MSVPDDPDPDRPREVDTGDPDPPTVDTSAPTLPAGPAWVIEDTELYLNVGDSIAAGYAAADEYGYARLLLENDDRATPDFRGADLASRSGARLVDLSESGAQSREILANLQDASLPAARGPVVVTISAGGNDFNDDPAVMLAAPLTRAVAATLRANLRSMVTLLRDRYPEVHVYFLTLHDPTDGTGSIPSRYDDGMCGVIQSVPGFLRPLGVSNLGIVNDAIAAEAADLGVGLIDAHQWFDGHGLGTSDGWTSGDCAHPTSRGHQELRRIVWGAWTGEWP